MKGSLDQRLYICNSIYQVVYEMLIMIGQGAGFGVRQREAVLLNLIELSALVRNIYLKYSERIIIRVVTLGKEKRATITTIIVY